MQYCTKRRWIDRHGRKKRREKERQVQIKRKKELFVKIIELYVLLKLILTNAQTHTPKSTHTYSLVHQQWNKNTNWTLNVLYTTTHTHPQQLYAFFMHFHRNAYEFHDIRTSEGFQCRKLFSTFSIKISFFFILSAHCVCDSHCCILDNSSNDDDDGALFLMLILRCYTDTTFRTCCSFILFCSLRFYCCVVVVSLLRCIFGFFIKTQYFIRKMVFGKNFRNWY